LRETPVRVPESRRQEKVSSPRAKTRSPKSKPKSGFKIQVSKAESSDNVGGAEVFTTFQKKAGKKIRRIEN